MSWEEEEAESKSYEAQAETDHDEARKWYEESAKKAAGRTYYLEYDARPYPDGIVVGEQRDGYGLTDALLTASIIRPEDGSYNILWMGMDGKTGEPLESHEIWKAWYLLAEKLREDSELAEDRRALCRLLCETVRALFGLPAIGEITKVG